MLALGALSSCDSYFDVDLNDQATLEEQFSKYNTAKQFSANCYAYLPYEEKQDAREGGVVRYSDESLFGFTSSASTNVYWQTRIGDSSPASFINGANGFTAVENGNYWKRYYQGIRQCSLVLENIHLLQEEKVDDKLRNFMAAEARFLRAYYYFCLFRYYGPVIIWGEEMAPTDIEGVTLDRNTVEENISFIVSELDKAIEDLPTDVAEIGGFVSASTDTGRPTKGAALALKARVLLYAASPLYNGGGENGENLYASMTNYNGDKIFPQEYDADKWTKAAEAAKAVIDMNKYNLVKKTDSADPFINAAESYRKVYDDHWNEETIWGWWYRAWEPGNDWLGTAGGAFPYYLPGKFGGIAYAYGGWIQPSLKLVDAYPMYESGRYPVTGYEHDGNGLNYSRPYVDEESGYETEGFVEDWKAPHLSWVPGVKAHKTTVGRDPRYYVTVLPNGHYYHNQSINTRVTMYQSSEAAAPWQAGTSCNYVGYAYVRLIPTENTLNDQTAYKSTKYVYPAFRMAEIYLNYAEALNEQPNRDGATACWALNQVRNRVGLNNIEVAYPGIEGDKELLRWCIQQERMVEFAMEGHRHYDACRWMIAKDEYPCANWTLHLSADNYEDSYERVDSDHPYANRPAVFKDKNYLFPMSSDELAEMTNYTQNFGY